MINSTVQRVMKRPLSIYPVAIWVMIALFTQIRPIAIGRHFSVSALSPDVRGTILLLLFLLITIEASALLRLRPVAILIAISTCAAWSIFMIVRVTIAILYGPDVFSRHASGVVVFIPPLFALILNLLVIRTLIFLPAPPLRNDARQALAKPLSETPHEEL